MTEKKDDQGIYVLISIGLFILVLFVVIFINALTPQTIKTSAELSEEPKKEIKKNKKILFSQGIFNKDRYLPEAILTLENNQMLEIKIKCGYFQTLRIAIYNSNLDDNTEWQELLSKNYKFKFKDDQGFEIYKLNIPKSEFETEISKEKYLYYVIQHTTDRLDLSEKECRNKLKYIELYY